MAKVKAVTESALAGLATVVVIPWVFTDPATLLALSIRHRYPDASFSGLITYYAVFAVLTAALVLAAIASRVVYLHASQNSD